MASESKYETPPATPEQKQAAREALAANSAVPVPAAFATGHLDSEAKEADVADGEMMVSDDPRAIEIVKGFGMYVLVNACLDTSVHPCDVQRVHDHEKC